MKKKILFLNLFFFVVLALAFITPTKVGAKVFDYTFTNSKALTTDGKVIPNSFGYFTYYNKNTNEQISADSLYYVTDNNVYYTVLFSSLTKEMLGNNNDPTTLFKVQVKDGYWAYLNYKNAFDFEHNLLPDGVGKFTNSFSSYIDVYGKQQFILEFTIYFRNGFILEEFEKYYVDTFNLPYEIKETFGSDNLIAVKNRAWTLVDDINVTSKKTEVKVYIDLRLLAEFVDVQPNSPNYKVPFFYLNFNVPVSSIEQIGITFTGIDKRLFGLIKKEFDFTLNITSDSSSILSYRKHSFPAIEKGEYYFSDVNENYYWKITPPIGSSVETLLIDCIKENSFGIAYLTYDYMECTYIFVEDELGYLDITHVDGPGYEPNSKGWLEQLFEDIVDWFKSNLFLLALIFIFVVVLSISYKIYVVNKISNKKRRN